jgi:hypothetical protein
LEKKGEKVRKREEQEEAVDFCNNQVRVGLTFNIIKGMILRIEFNMIRLSFGENWD